MKTARMTAALLACAICGAVSFAGPARPNVLLVSLDTLRADHLGCYGYRRDTSPNLDKLAKEGILFEEMTAASSWTVPSHMSIFTGLYPSVHGVENAQKQLGDAVPTMAEILAEHGYTTAGFVTGPSLNHAMGFHRGFRLYDDFTVTLMHTANLFHDLDVEKSELNQVPTNATVTNLATSWLKKHADKKFFLFVHYWDCHSDYIPPEPYDKKFDPEYTGPEDGRNVSNRRAGLEQNATPEIKERLTALYDGEIAQTDGQVGNLLKALDEMKLKENTLVIILSDHGDGLWEHGLLEHGNSLYEELIHVPLIMRFPGVLPANVRIKGNVSHVDILPTLLGALGLPKPQIVHGMDLSEVCRGKGELPDRPVFSELDLAKKMKTVRWGPYKVIQETSSPAGALLVVRNGRENEAANEGMEPEAALDIQRRLVTALNAGPANAMAPARLARPAEPDEKTLRLLRSLGYVQ